MQHLRLKGVVVDGQGHVWVAARAMEAVSRRAGLASGARSDLHARNPKKHVTVGSWGLFAAFTGWPWMPSERCGFPSGIRVSRIDPQAGGPRVRGHAIPVGAVDLRVDIGADARPYTYSDMTGFVSWNTFPQGTWTHTVDAEHFDALWYRVIAQATTPEGSSMELRVRASNDRATLDLLPYVLGSNRTRSCGTSRAGTCRCRSRCGRPRGP
jgi:hypothetical protein